MDQMLTGVNKEFISYIAVSNCEQRERERKGQLISCYGEKGKRES